MSGSISDSHITGSFTGSFTGDGTGLTAAGFRYFQQLKEHLYTKHKTILYLR